MGCAGYVAAWPAEAFDESSLDGVAPHLEDDGYSRGRRLCRQRRGSRGRGNHGHLLTNQIGCQRRQAVVLVLRPTVFDRHVLALDLDGFAQTLSECRYH